MEKITWKNVQKHSDVILADGIWEMTQKPFEGYADITHNDFGNYLISHAKKPYYIGEAKDICKRLKQQFKPATAGKSSSIGRCHRYGQKFDVEVLQILLALIYESPLLRNFIAFIQTLNFFYSTRLQTAIGRRNDTIIKAAALMKRNWKQKINLSRVADRTVDVQKVEQFRSEVKNCLGNDYYSFSTKVFHQLNPQYPIVDTNVKKFMKKHGYSKGKNYSNSSRSYEEFYRDFTNMMKVLKWPLSHVETIDIAIWELVSSNRKYYS